MYQDLKSYFVVAADVTAGDSMALLEAKAQRMAAEEEAQKQLLTAGTTPRLAPSLSKGGNISFVRGETQEQREDTRQERNPEEIDIDQMDEDEGQDANAQKQGYVSFRFFNVFRVYLRIHKLLSM